MKRQVVMYFKPGCAYAAKLRLKLRMARIPFEAVAFESDPEASLVVRAINRGNEISPTVRVGNRYLSNPGVREIRAALSAEV